MSAVAVEPVLLADARIASIPVDECGEPLVRLRRCHRGHGGGASPVPPLGLLAGAPDDAYAHVREGLAHAPRTGSRPAAGRASSARRRGLSARRRRSWPTSRRTGRSSLADDPRLTHEESQTLASRLRGAAGGRRPPVGRRHRRHHRRPARRGRWTWARPSMPPRRRAAARATSTPRRSTGARGPRGGCWRRCLGDAGFVNYPTEWWHWSFGDRYWAFVTGHGAARYGQVARLP